MEMLAKMLKNAGVNIGTVINENEEEVLNAEEEEELLGATEQDVEHDSELQEEIDLKYNMQRIAGIVSDDNIDEEDVF